MNDVKFKIFRLFDSNYYDDPETYGRLTLLANTEWETCSYDEFCELRKGIAYINGKASGARSGRLYVIQEPDNIEHQNLIDLSRQAVYNQVKLMEKAAQEQLKKKEQAKAEKEAKALERKRKQFEKLKAELANNGA